MLCGLSWEMTPWWLVEKVASSAVPWEVTRVPTENKSSLPSPARCHVMANP